ncbi:hypothetical protein PPERSA_05449 [Pseudocohnilembus persalinus]|uniref:histone deacetylase n=1 Tax=Pseudocohnilembus persalinus TaxID=266149 RepID=A0A0V0R8P5_PSEPJ|nr:hypothetical protein PPERSA_05449 [Pseudocohnilembus persalinus]|eukprot:KRX10629.1 hypothetical protein PPERSA_05449 [Pseudocohnilembus persalinus]
MESLTSQVNNLNLQGKKQITGLIFDPFMLKHKSKRQHVENPARLIQILDHFKNQNFLSDNEKLSQQQQNPENNTPNQQQLQKQYLIRENADIHIQQSMKYAKREDILLAHTEKYVDFIDNMWPQNYNNPNIYYLDTYVNENTRDIAYLGTGGVIQAITNILNETWTNCFALIRPPGHHSGHSDFPAGFCVLNYVSIGAKYAIQKLNQKKIVVLDWDIHHGDGSQNLLKNDPNIIYISLHRHDNGMFYPGISGSVDNIGEGDAKGFNLNFPWNLDLDNGFTARNDEYIFIFERLIIPIIKEFAPDLLIVSSGFDGCINDPLGQCEITIDGYAYMTARLKEVMNDKILICLEGGYNLDMIPHAAEGVFRALTGETLPIKNSLNNQTMKQVIQNCTPNKVGMETFKTCYNKFKEYWPILQTDKEALEFEENCLKNIQNSYRYNPLYQNQLQDLQEANVIKQIRDPIDLQRAKYQYSNFTEFNDFFPKLLNFQEIFSNQNENENESSQLLFENIFNECPQGSILKIRFGNIFIINLNNIQEQPSQFWKSQRFLIEQLIIKDSDAVPQKVVLKEKIMKKDKDIDIPYMIQNLFYIQEQQKLNLEILKQTIDQLKQIQQIYTQFSQKQDITQFELTILVDQYKNQQNVKISKIDWANSPQLEDIPLSVFENIEEGLQNFISILEQIKNQNCSEKQE